MESEDPITLAAIGTGMSVGGTTLSAYGKYQEGHAAAKAYEFNARQATGEAAYEEAKSRDKLRTLMGQQRALYAKAGVDISSGSPLMMLEETAMQGEEEAQNILIKGQNEAKINRYYAKQAKTAGYIGAGSTFFTGLGQAGTQYAGVKGK